MLLSSFMMHVLTKGHGQDRYCTMVSSLGLGLCVLASSSVAAASCLANWDLDEPI